MAHILSSVSTLTPTFTHPSTFSPIQYTQHMLHQLKWSPFLSLQRHPPFYTLQPFTHSRLHTPTVYTLPLFTYTDWTGDVRLCLKWIPTYLLRTLFFLLSFFPGGQKLCASLLAISLLSVTQTDSQRVSACPLSYSWARWWDLHLQTKVLTWSNVIWTAAQCCFTN